MRNLFGLLAVGTRVLLKEDKKRYDELAGKEATITKHITYFETKKGYRLNKDHTRIYVENDFAAIGIDSIENETR